mmetsp:Transcript_18547/g.25789  ORF Transcript_18547/g.25789 Transcript_18547/m.25789 type:complete len:399 (-) Transcript_18547:82-1278(-)
MYSDMADSEFRIYCENFALTPSLRPKLSDGEIEYCFGNHVRVYHRDKIAHENGSCHLSSHRIYWLANKRKQGSKLPVFMFSVRLSNIASVSRQSSLFSSPKIILNLNGVRPSKSGKALFIKLSFRDGMRDKFFDRLKSALAKKAWLEPQKAAKRQGFSTTSAGIRGLIEREKKRVEKAEREVDEAFKDLDALMAKASAIVDLAKKYSSGMAARSDGKKEEKDQFLAMLTDMGIPNPVTRESAGSKYHEQLARQLADFFMQEKDPGSGKTRLNGLGGMITLPDAFCIFNRARGTEMVSPNDLLNACELLETLHLPIAFRRFPSDVMVIQAKDLSEKKICDRIVEHIKSSGAVSPIELSRDFSISLVLAHHHLNNAEQSAYICRDQSEDGIRYYINLFIQ